MEELLLLISLLGLVGVAMSVALRWLRRKPKEFN